MNRKLLHLLTIFFLLISQPSFSQNIDGDTIKISKSIPATIVFPEDIQLMTPLYPKENYACKVHGNRITITASVNNPLSPCYLLIDEGTTEKQRNHRFILIFISDPGMATSIDPYHDFSTVSKLKKHIEYLETSKDAAPPQPAAGNTGNKSMITVTDPAQGSGSGDNAYVADSSSIQLTDGTRIYVKDIEKEIDAKTEALRLCLIKLCRRLDVPNTVEYGMKLFNNDETRTVQTISAGAAPKTIPIRTYLGSLSRLHYNHVDIKWRVGRFVSKLIPQSDGKTYEGVVTLEQEFTGTFDKEGRPTYRYHDVTKKTITIIIKIYDNIEDGKAVKKYDVFLGDIAVDQQAKS